MAGVGEGGRERHCESCEPIPAMWNADASAFLPRNFLTAILVIVFSVVARLTHLRWDF